VHRWQRGQHVTLTVRLHVFITSFRREMDEQRMKTEMAHLAGLEPALSSSQNWCFRGRTRIRSRDEAPAPIVKPWKKPSIRSPGFERFTFGPVYRLSYRCTNVLRGSGCVVGLVVRVGRPWFGCVGRAGEVDRCADVRRGRRGAETYVRTPRTPHQGFTFQDFSFQSFIVQSIMISPIIQSGFRYDSAG
jgi:hypothetical protein